MSLTLRERLRLELADLGAGVANDAYARASVHYITMLSNSTQAERQEAYIHKLNAKKVLECACDVVLEMC